MIFLFNTSYCQNFKYLPKWFKIISFCRIKKFPFMWKEVTGRVLFENKSLICCPRYFWIVLYLVTINVLLSILLLKAQYNHQNRKLTSIHCRHLIFNLHSVSTNVLYLKMSQITQNFSSYITLGFFFSSSGTSDDNWPIDIMECT